MVAIKLVSRVVDRRNVGYFNSWFATASLSRFVFFFPLISVSMDLPKLPEDLEVPRHLNKLNDKRIAIAVPVVGFQSCDVKQKPACRPWGMRVQWWGSIVPSMHLIGVWYPVSLDFLRSRHCPVKFSVRWTEETMSVATGKFICHQLLNLELHILLLRDTNWYSISLTESLSRQWMTIMTSALLCLSMETVRTATFATQQLPSLQSA